jgi:hypothetical protein
MAQRAQAEIIFAMVEGKKSPATGNQNRMIMMTVQRKRSRAE